MKTLENNVIYYDEVCPMCNLYTGAFIKTGMLGKEGRKPYQQINEAEAGHIDMVRAVSEIALFDSKTGEVTYGINSLMKILTHSWPRLRYFAGCRPFMWLITKLYRFISYNRRVIIPAAKSKALTQHEPPLEIRYRIVFLVVTWLMTATILNGYSSLLTGLIPSGGFYREFLICGGQIIWQSLVSILLYKKLDPEYLGNMMTISFGGGLLLLPVLIVSDFTTVSSEVAAAYFLIVAGLMFLEHTRRVKLLQLNPVLTVSWIVYRLLLLWVIS